MQRKKLFRAYGIPILVLLILLATVVVSACKTSQTTSPSTTKNPVTTTTTTKLSTPTATATGPATTSSTTKAPSGAPQTGGILKIISNGEPDVMGPVSAIVSGRGISLLPCVEPLVGLDVKGVPAPTKLATSWDIAQDGTSITFHLRQGVKFQDGTTFDATAAKYNLDQLIGVRAEMASVNSTTIVDNNTIRINLNTYDSTLLYQLSYICGFMESPTALQAHATDKAWLSTNAVGTGPFILTSWTRSVSMKFQKFNGYWDQGKPYLDGMEFDFIPSIPTSVAALKAGDAQMYYTALPQDAQSLGAVGFQYNTLPYTMNALFTDSNNPSSPFINLKVRQALDYAIDKKSICSAVGFGMWEAPNQAISAAQTGYIPNFQGRDFNTAKAKQLLAEAGYTNGFSTNLHVITVANQNAYVAVKTYLELAGIKVNLNVIDPPTYSSITRQGWQNGIFAGGLGIVNNYIQMLTSDGPGKTREVSTLLSPQYLADINQAKAATDINSYTVAVQKLVQQIFDDATCTPVWIETGHAVYTNVVHSDINTINSHYWDPGDAWLSH